MMQMIQITNRRFDANLTNLSAARKMIDSSLQSCGWAHEKTDILIAVGEVLQKYHAPRLFHGAGPGRLFLPRHRSQ